MEPPRDDAPTPGEGVVWPPRHQPPRLLPGGAEAPLTLDASDVPPPEPDFTEARFTRHEPRFVARLGTGEAPSRIVPFDPRNPSGRTRADAVLRPNDEDRKRRVHANRARAAATGAGVVLFAMVVFAHGPTSLYVLGALLGAGAGTAAFQAGDSSWSWAGALLSIGAFVGFSQSPIGLLILTSGLAGLGWIVGLAREMEG